MYPENAKVRQLKKLTSMITFSSKDSRSRLESEGNVSSQKSIAMSRKPSAPPKKRIKRKLVSNASRSPVRVEEEYGIMNQESSKFLELAYEASSQLPSLVEPLKVN